jgi:hypothetical protein
LLTSFLHPLTSLLHPLAQEAVPSCSQTTEYKVSLTLKFSLV